MSKMSPNDLLKWQESGFQQAIGEVTEQLNIVNSLSTVATKVAEVNKAFSGEAAQAHATETAGTVGRIGKVVTAGHGILTILHEKSVRLARCKQQLQNLTVWYVDREQCIKKYGSVAPPFVVPNPARTSVDPSHPARTANLNAQIVAIMADANKTDWAGYIKIGAHLADLALAFAPKKKAAATQTTDSTKSATTPVTATTTQPQTTGTPSANITTSTSLAGAGQPLTGTAAAAAGSSVRPLVGAATTPAAGALGAGGYYGAPVGAGAGSDRRRATTTDWSLNEEDELWTGRAAPTEDGVVT